MKSNKDVRLDSSSWSDPMSRVRNNTSIKKIAHRQTATTQ